jgi:hypothetical protein
LLDEARSTVIADLSRRFVEALVVAIRTDTRLYAGKQLDRPAFTFAGALHDEVVCPRL